MPIRLSRHKLIKLFLGFIDLKVTLTTLFIASYLVHRYTWEEVNFASEFFIVAAIVLFIWIVLLKATNLARIPRTSSAMVILGDFIRLSTIGGFILFVLDLIIKFDSFPSIAIGLFVILNFISLFVIRLITFKTVRLFRANGHNIRNVAIIANDQSGPIIEKILSQKEWGIKILYIITDSAIIRQQFRKVVKIHPKNVNIKSLLRYDIVDELICFDCTSHPEKLYKLIDFCSTLGITVRVQAKIPLPLNYSFRTRYLYNIPFLTIENTPINNYLHSVKSILEIGIAFCILITLSPFLLAIGLAIKLTSDGPIVFKQERVGLHGRKFYIYKFRTMVINAEELKAKLLALNESDGPTFKIKRDPRITHVGRILRKTNLDEVPQLFNVIKGEMSLIGPRPPLPCEVSKYEEWQLKRLAVKPGLTCTWQIVPNRNDVKFDNWVRMDIQYIDNWSLKSDVELFFKTFKTVLFARGA